jgi:hypothetical protein
LLELPAHEAIQVLGLNADSFLSDLKKTPRFGDVEKNLTFRGYKRVVFEIDAVEAMRSKIKPGFYLSCVRPEEVFDTQNCNWNVFGQHGTSLSECFVPEANGNHGGLQARCLTTY